jgi:hypothetical protein
VHCTGYRSVYTTCSLTDILPPLFQRTNWKYTHHISIRDKQSSPENEASESVMERCDTHGSHRVGSWSESRSEWILVNVHYIYHLLDASDRGRLVTTRFSNEKIARVSESVSQSGPILYRLQETNDRPQRSVGLRVMLSRRNLVRME